jgi:hypothetical protein
MAIEPAQGTGCGVARSLPAAARVRNPHLSHHPNKAAVDAHHLPLDECMCFFTRCNCSSLPPPTQRHSGRRHLSVLLGRCAGRAVLSCSLRPGHRPIGGVKRVGSGARETKRGRSAAWSTKSPPCQSTHWSALQHSSFASIKASSTSKRRPRVNTPSRLQSKPATTPSPTPPCHHFPDSFTVLALPCTRLAALPSLPATSIFAAQTIDTTAQHRFSCACIFHLRRRAYCPHSEQHILVAPSSPSRSSSVHPCAPPAHAANKSTATTARQEAPNTPNVLTTTAKHPSKEQSSRGSASGQRFWQDLAWNAEQCPSSHDRDRYIYPFVQEQLPSSCTTSPITFTNCYFVLAQ